MKYNPALDGLRALAIISVIGFHWHVTGFWGGFFGVDVFFVLSGFLITSLLVGEFTETGKFSIWVFYLKRFIRLGPQLALLLAAYLMTAPFAWPQIAVSEHMLDAAIVGAYFSDYAIAFWGRPQALPQTWSLAVEEHYYLVWPVALLTLLRLPARRLIAALIALYLAATTWRFFVFWLTGDWLQTYARFDTRLSGLVLGGIVAIAVRCGAALKRKRADTVGFACLGTLVVYLVTSNYLEDSSLTWRLVIVELASAGLILALASCNDCGVSRLFSIAPLAFIGLISYGLYLWHYPVMLAMPAEWSMDARRALAFVISVVVAAASYMLIERPIRSLRRRWPPRGPQTPAASTARGV